MNAAKRIGNIIKKVAFIFGILYVLGILITCIMLIISNANGDLAESILIISVVFILYVTVILFGILLLIGFGEGLTTLGEISEQLGKIQSTQVYERSNVKQYEEYKPKSVEYSSPIIKEKDFKIRKFEE